MARISTYPLDNSVVGTDKWIGTDSSAKKLTKNFSADAVAAYLNTSGIIESQALRYTYQDVTGSEVRKNGTISFDTTQGINVPFSGITTWKLSRYAKPSKAEETFYDSPLVGQQILITNANNPSSWAIFDWVSSTQDVLEPDFYDIALTLVSSTGDLVDGQDYLISLIYNAAGGGDKNFVFTAPSSPAVSVWDITHNLNKYPSVSVVNTANEIIIGAVEYISVNQLTITFRASGALVATQGKAFLN